MSEPSDFELWDEIADAEVVPLVDVGTSGARLDKCMKCEYRHALVCTKLQTKGASRMNIATAIKRDDVRCPDGRWA